LGRLSSEVNGKVPGGLEAAGDLVLAFAEMNTHAPSTPVPTVDREELQARLARGDAFKLVMASRDWAFDAKHIPGSIHFHDPAEMLAALGRDDEIVVYCSNVDCRASALTIKLLREHGYTRVAHYPGGLIDWENGGLPLVGDWV
jgi:rhodanese-related sulfurtransferase